MIVRLAQPLARRTRTRTPSRSSARAARRRTWPRGSRSSGGRGALRRQARRTTRRAGSRARALERYGVDVARPGRGGPHRHDRLARRAPTGAGRWPPTAASRPSCRRDELDPAWLDGCTHLHLPVYSLAARADRRRAAQRAAELAPRRQRRPLLLERDPRLRAASGSASGSRRSRPDVVFANEDEEQIARRAARGAATWIAQARTWRRALRRPRAAGGAGRGGRLDRRRRRARRRLPRRRPRAGARGGRTLRGATRLDAVKDLLARSRTRWRTRSPSGAPSSRSRRRSSRTASRPARASRSGSRASAASVRRAPCPRRSASSTAQLRIGLTEDELGALHRGRAQGRAARPRRRVVQGAVGATTVGGTLAACRAAGIGFMGTGGLGGVHRGFPASAGRLGRPRRARPDRGADRLLGRQVDPRRAGDGRAARDARRAGARLPHRRPAALLRGARRPARLGAGRVGRRGGAGRAGALAARPPHLDPARPARRRQPRRRRAADRAGARRGARRRGSPARP